MSSPENHPAGKPQDSTRPVSGDKPGAPATGQPRAAGPQTPSQPGTPAGAKSTAGPQTAAGTPSPAPKSAATSGKETAKTKSPKGEWGVFRTVVVLVGLVLAGFGAYYLITGTSGLPDTDISGPSPTLESQFRFFAAMMVGVGAAFITIGVKFEWANMLWMVCLMVFIGGIGRVLSWAFSGTPHFLMIILMVIELAFPAALLVWHRYIAKTTEIRNEYAARG
ncbi:DUF4345 domain-containing protein [Arthrobacter sp. H20]|uniref:DUF4345 domain-containing protein n=1 Tax=Arthrobacter sp. H20 TaxID=1267981 RepID=UPI000687FE14|nr:DUF4345 domain-containing protein [Arthrobacter sp. H20]